VRIPGLKSLRLSSRWLRSRITPGVIILGYHRVANKSRDPHLMCVHPQHFAEQLDNLRKLANLISLGDLKSGLLSNNLPKRAVVLTFDDGYADIWYQAWPLLEKFEIPATLFVASGFLGRQFSWDELEQGGYDADTAQITHERALNSDELIRLAATGMIEIASHSVNHPELAKLPIPEQVYEIQKSKQALEEIINRPVTSFSYPHGSVSKVTRQLVSEAGYRCACASHNDVVLQGSDPYCLPRFWVPDWNGERFNQWLLRWL
jgi:peptidoglycan/xylan/chitin deacetylase (PgdA/CDA1 family)